jgi:hypothetical protein
MAPEKKVEFTITKVAEDGSHVLVDVSVDGKVYAQKVNGAPVTDKEALQTFVNDYAIAFSKGLDVEAVKPEVAEDIAELVGKKTEAEVPEVVIPEPTPAPEPEVTPEVTPEPEVAPEAVPEVVDDTSPASVIYGDEVVAEKNVVISDNPPFEANPLPEEVTPEAVEPVLEVAGVDEENKVVTFTDGETAPLSTREEVVAELGEEAVAKIEAEAVDASEVVAEETPAPVVEEAPVAPTEETPA